MNIEILHKIVSDIQNKACKEKDMKEKENDLYYKGICDGLDLVVDKITDILRQKG